MGVTLTFERHYRSSLEEVWALICNTDAFNRAAGLAMRFDRVESAWRGRQALGPMTVTWTEDQLQFRAPHHFQSVRRYDNGPVQTATATADLTETDQGVALRYVLQLEPRGYGSMVLPVAKTVLRRQLERGFRAIDRALAGEPDAIDPPPPLEPSVSAHLEETLGHLDEACRSALSRRIHGAPLVVQDQLRPLRIAADEGISPQVFTRACLVAVQAGVLELRWALLCPRCRGAMAERSSLSADFSTAHCPSCDIGYDGALADNVEALFRPSAAIRKMNVVVDCVLSPARTPHVLARLLVKANGRIRWPVRLQPGCYVLDAGTRSTLIEVAPDNPTTEVVVVDLQSVGLRPSIVRVAPGAVEMVVRSRLDQACELTLLKRWRPGGVLTAARLLADPVLRAVLPVAVLDGVGSRSYRAFVVVVEAEVSELDELPAPFVRLANRLSAATFSSAGDALEEAERLAARRRPVSAGLAEGLVVEVSRSGALTLAGEAFEDAIAAIRRVGVPQTAVASNDHDAFASAIPDGRMVLLARDELPSVLAFAAIVDAPVDPVPDAPQHDTSLPAVVAGYAVMRELDRGGMGRVLEVVDADGGRLAVKQILPEYLSDEVLAAFFRESWYAVQITHPNVVRFLDWGVEDERPYLVMECLVGRSLQRELETNGLWRPPAVIPLLDALLGALGAIHAQGLVHRDIKPSNVFLLNEPGDVPAGVKLLDFGLMRRAGRSRHERFVGTPSYMSPEQILMDSVDERADLFSLALVAYKLLTGKLPFRGKTAGERAIRRLDDHASAIRDDPRLGGLAPFLARALRSDPADRFASTDAMLQALRAVPISG